MSTLRSTDFVRTRFEAHLACSGCPSPDRVARWFDELLGALFPDRSNRSFVTLDEFEAHLSSLEAELASIVAAVPGDRLEAPKELAADLMEALPGIVADLDQDVDAIERGDPAATGRSEVVRSYPGFYAIAAYRIAHALHRAGLPMVPRMITEHAHGRTGIDIHPGATIGRRFCIDHGTGIVIGETAEIGDDVKMYQGVTLGGLSVRKADARTKRHPTIEDGVVLYAGATILGGATTVGRGSVIGGNVWLTSSVPPGSRVSYQARLVSERSDATGLVVQRQEPV
jgi:serine O-acetyltransferase